MAKGSYSSMFGARRSEPKFQRQPQPEREFRRVPTIMGARPARSLIFGSIEEPTPPPAPAEAPEPTGPTIEQCGEVARILVEALGVEALNDL